MAILTSKNLTIGGIGAIVLGIGNALVQYQKGGIAGVDWPSFYTIVIVGTFGIFAKGQQSTGGTVNNKGQAVTDPAPPVVTAALPAAPKTPPAALLLIFCLALPVLARADTANPVTPATPQNSSLVLQLPHGWTLRPNVTVGSLTGYNFSNKTWVTNVSIGGLYVFDWKEKFCAGAGGSLSVGGKTPTTLYGDLMVGGPVVPLTASTIGLRPALVADYTNSGGIDTFRLLGTISLQF